ncbi:hypothetical protein ACIOEX_01145 [Streptomyces sp. NPDC087850]|uniref:hypothetical protein n=1 Tax=Streptomyces sp. NPDC087850 TaxID=3365809 RepID=UPI0037FC1817
MPVPLTPARSASSGAPVERILYEADRRLAVLGLDRVATRLLALIDSGPGTCALAGRGAPSATAPAPRHQRRPATRRH